jgi:hypothetical protein
VLGEDAAELTLMKLAKSEPQLEITCLGLRVKASGSLAVVIVALLSVSLLVLRALHLS